MKNQTAVLYTTAVIGLFVLIVALAPLLLLWALNTLFALAVPYSLSTWAAALVLLIVFRGRGMSASKS